MLSFSLFLPSLKANVLFKNSSGSKIVMFVCFGECVNKTESYEFIRYRSNRLEKDETLVISFMRDPSHDLFYKKIAFKIINKSYEWGPFYLKHFNLNYNYKIYTNEECLWFLGHNVDGVFVTDTCKGVSRSRYR